MKKLRHILARPDRDLRKLPRIPFELLRLIARNSHPRNAPHLRQSNPRGGNVIKDQAVAVSAVNFGILSLEKDNSAFNPYQMLPDRTIIRQPLESDTCKCCTTELDDDVRPICLCCFVTGFPELEFPRHHPKLALCIRVMLRYHWSFTSCRGNALDPIDYLCTIGNPTAASFLLSQQTYTFQPNIWAIHDSLEKLAEEAKSDDMKEDRLKTIKQIYSVLSEIPSPIQQQHQILSYASTQNTESHDTFIHQCALLNLKEHQYTWQSPYLIHAVRQHLPDVLAMLLTVPGEKADMRSQEALELACEIGDMEMVKMLFDSDRPWMVGCDAGGDALRKGNVELFEWLVRKEALDCRCFADLAELDEFDRLVQIEALPEAGRMDVEQIFARAVAFGRVEFLIRFCEQFEVDLFEHANGFGKDAAFWKYETPLLVVAISFGHVEMVGFLIHSGADLNAAGGAAIRMAAMEGKIELVRILIDAGCDVDAVKACKRKENYCPSALEEAVVNGHVEVVKVLLEKGADVNKNGGTIFKRAVGIIPSVSPLTTNDDGSPDTTKPKRPNPAILRILLTHPTANPYHIHSAFHSLIRHILTNTPTLTKTQNPDRKRLKFLRRTTHLLSLFITTNKMLSAGLVESDKKAVDKYGRTWLGNAGDGADRKFVVLEEG
ncbi:hypothetical protein HK097_003969, partial [Rhizophlyctis rosea]